MAKIQGTIFSVRPVTPLYFVLYLGCDLLLSVLDSILHDESSKSQRLCGWGA